MKVVFRVLALGALSALAACNFLPHPIFPDATRVTATNDATAPIATGQLLVDEEVVYAIFVPSAVVNQRPLLYLEVEVLNLLAEVEITAHDLLGRAYAQSDSPDHFSAPVVSGRALSADGDAPMAVQSIVPTILCRGPCILQPAEVTTVYLKIRNTGFDSTNYNLYAFTEAYSDTNEPINNTLGGAVEFGGSIQGALETLDDVDFYLTARPVRSIRIAGPTGPVTVLPTAVLTDYVTGASRGEVAPGTTITFEPPVRVQMRVSSDNDRAGPSASSFYEITTTE